MASCCVIGRSGRLLVLVLAALGFGTAAAQTMNTISGTGANASSGDGGPALLASHANPVGIAVDPAGNIFVADVGSYLVRRIAPDGIITTVAGNGQPVFATDTETNVGDGGPATAAAISPQYVATDASGNLFIADMRHHRIRKVTPAGIITTIAGNGLVGYTGDGGAATNARFQNFGGLAVDAGGNVLVSSGHGVRKISTGGIVTTIAGSASYGFSGDGGSATLARLNTPRGLATDSMGNLYIADYGNGRIRKVAGGIISSVMGGGKFLDDFFATGIDASTPIDVATDSAGYVYVAFENRKSIMKVSPTGLLANAAGFACPYATCSDYDHTGVHNEGGLFSTVNLTFPKGIEVDASNRLLVADSGHNRIRRVSGPTPAAVAPEAAEVLKAPESYGVSGNTDAVAIGDFNGDGRNDVAVATVPIGPPLADDMKVLLYLQQANGSLAAPVKAAFGGAASDERPHLFMVDLDHDGRKDIVVGRLLGITVFRGNGGGTLTAEATTFADGWWNTSVPTDYNRDGNLDMVGFGYRSESGYVLWKVPGNGSGGFGAPTFQLNTGPVWQVVAGDVDNDGDEDLLSGGLNLASRIYHHDGASAYQAGGIVEFTLASYGITIGDANDDGRADLLRVGMQANILHQEARGRIDGPLYLRLYDTGTHVRLVDMNGDGRSDLLAWMGTTGLAYFQRKAGGYTFPRKIYFMLANSNNNATGFAVGRLDADACPDLAFATGLGLTVVRGQNCAAAPALVDTDGDGASDLAWSSTGGVELWPAGNPAQSLHVPVAGGWVLAAIGPSTNGRPSDMVWRNCLTQAVAVGQRPLAASRQLPGPDRSWNLAAVADFDGNGRVDFLWMHASGATRLWFDAEPARSRAGATLARGWSVAAVGDFDGDGRADIFWRHAPTGANLIWRAGGTLGGTRVDAVLDGAWQVAGSGDFDNDGAADLLWRNRRSGWNSIWPGADAHRRRDLPTVADAAWTVASVGDLDGDRRADIVWQHAGTGSSMVWPRADKTLARAGATIPGDEQPWRAAASCYAPAGFRRAAR